MTRDPADRDFVCEACFRDPTLREFVRDRGEPGQCFWCGTRGAPRTHIRELTQAFRDVANYYVPTADIDAGESIEWRFREDWNVFADEISDSTETTRELILRILEHGFHPKDDVDVNLDAYRGLLRHPASWLLDRWVEDAIDEPDAGGGAVDPGREQARPTSDQEPGTTIEVQAAPHEGALEGLDAPEFQYEYLELAFEDLAATVNGDTKMYRARIHEYGGQGERFDAGQLGAPPPEKARSSRASRAGRPVLYTASDLATAVAEVRGWKGAAVAVSEVRAREGLFLVDLRHPEKFSPFFVENLQWYVALRELLWCLAEDMAYPVDPQVDDALRDRLYRPTQYLCERIEAAGYAGVIHASAAGPGHNVVFFDPERATVSAPVYLRVEEMRPEAVEMGPYDELYGQRPYDPDADGPSD